MEEEKEDAIIKPKNISITSHDQDDGIRTIQVIDRHEEPKHDKDPDGNDKNKTSNTQTTEEEKWLITDDYGEHQLRSPQSNKTHIKQRWRRQVVRQLQALVAQLVKQRHRATL